jgi:hypothetical protein
MTIKVWWHDISLFVNIFIISNIHSSFIDTFLTFAKAWSGFLIALIRNLHWGAKSGFKPCLLSSDECYAESSLIYAAPYLNFAAPL